MLVDNKMLEQEIIFKLEPDFEVNAIPRIKCFIDYLNALIISCEKLNEEKRSVARAKRVYRKKSVVSDVEG